MSVFQSVISALQNHFSQNKKIIYFAISMEYFHLVEFRCITSKSKGVFLLEDGAGFEPTTFQLSTWPQYSYNSRWHCHTSLIHTDCPSAGRGSDSECDTPQRKMPDVRKDDMLVRRTSYSEPRTAVPFNQYLPNKANQSSYMPAPVRRPRSDRDDNCKSWSDTTSPVGGERPFR